MDKFEDASPEIKGQRMYGFQDLSLINNYMDNTMIHEKIAGELFRSFDVSSCKATFIRLYVDYGQGKKYFGLYTMDEMPEGPLLKKWFGNKKGNLYKPDGTGARFVEFVDISFAEKNNNNTGCRDVKAVFEALHGDHSNPASWRKELEKAFDVPIFLKWLAVNSVIANWDAYGAMPHNYYLYNDNDKLKWIPWDLGLSFSESGGMGMGTGASGNDVAAQITHNQTDSTWPLIRYLLDDATYRAKYFGYVRAFLQTDFTLGSLTAKIQSAKNLVAPYVTGAEPEQTGYTFLTTPQDFETAHNSLVQFISKQIISVDSVLAVSH
jgi:spore coat protein CotH